MLFANSDYLGSGRVQNITSPPIALSSDSFEFKVNFNNEILNYISKNRESFSRTVKFLPINEKEDDLSLVIPDIVDMDYLIKI
ncbi:MAG: hypothetical protein K0Q49_545 [Haloplasmataceae bacterium]|nr:hypothetical protein [Haloplasmataceae bacterium]